MAFTDDQARKVAREVAARIYTQSITATMNLDDLKAAINAIDTVMDTVINTIPGPAQTNTIKQGLLSQLPEPFKSETTTAQKALALSLWAFEEAGVL